VPSQPIGTYCREIMRLFLFVLGLAAVAVGDIVFVAVGDWGDSGSSGQARQQNVASIMNDWCAERDCDFIISTGDNFYPDGAEAVDDDRFNYNWRDVYTGDAIKDLTWYISVGNHDHIDGNEIYQLEFAQSEDRWYFPYYYYSFEVTDGTSAVFYAMDSEALRLNKYNPAEQLAEMDQVLGDSTARWKIVFGHHPPLSVGRRWGDQTILDDVVPICVKHDVDALITGHDHNLQHIVKRSDVDVEYVVSGAGGRSSYAYESGNEDIINELGYEPLFFDETYGFVGVTLTENLMTVEYYDYTTSGSDVNIRELYSFTRQNVAASKKK